MTRNSSLRYLLPMEFLRASLEEFLKYPWRYFGKKTLKNIPNKSQETFMKQSMEKYLGEFLEKPLSSVWHSCLMLKGIPKITEHWATMLHMAALEELLGAFFFCKFRGSIPGEISGTAQIIPGRDT